MKPKEFDAEAYLDQASAALQLPIDPAHRPGVVANLQTLARMADLVLSSPHGEAEEEPAPVFVP